MCPGSAQLYEQGRENQGLIKYQVTDAEKEAYQAFSLLHSDNRIHGPHQGTPSGATDCSRRPGPGGRWMRGGRSSGSSGGGSGRGAGGAAGGGNIGGM